MSYDVCKAEWIGSDGKDHGCDRMKDHAGLCRCDCGASHRVVNKIASYGLKPFYKRRKEPKG